MHDAHLPLAGKVAVVTGADRGIGQAVAVELAANGACVVVNYLGEHVSPQATLDQIRGRKGTARAVAADISSAEARRHLIAEGLREFGRIDILVNNAGLDLGATPFLDVDEELFDRVMAVNLKGAYFCSQLAAAHMVERGGGGRILFIGSVQGLAVAPMRSVYAASKAALAGLARSLAVDLGQYGITVNTIAPGFIEVERIRERPGYSREESAERIPMRRVGFPGDVASLASFLASDQAGYLTGQVIVVDGGAAVLLSSVDPGLKPRMHGASRL